VSFSFRVESSFGFPRVASERKVKLIGFLGNLVSFSLQGFDGW